MFFLDLLLPCSKVTLSHIANHGAYKEVYKKYASIGWKTRKEKFAAEHREELDV